MATLLNVSGTSGEVVPAGGTITAEWLRGLVEGYVEIIRCDDGSAFAVDEDAAWRDVPANVVATIVALAKGCRGLPPEGLRGPVVFLSADEMRGFA